MGEPDSIRQALAQPQRAQRGGQRRRQFGATAGSGAVAAAAAMGTAMAAMPSLRLPRCRWRPPRTSSANGGEAEERRVEIDPLTKPMKEALGSPGEDDTVSRRMTDSPCVLTIASDSQTKAPFRQW